MTLKKVKGTGFENCREIASLLSFQTNFLHSHHFLRKRWLEQPYHLTLPPLVASLGKLGEEAQVLLILEQSNHETLGPMLGMSWFTSPRSLPWSPQNCLTD